MASDGDDQSQDDSQLEATLRLFDAGVSQQAIEQLASLHPADQADVVGQLDSGIHDELLPRISHEALAEILAHLRDARRVDIVAELPSETLAPVLDLLDFNIAVDVLHELPAERARATLQAMTTASDVAPLLPYADETAGGLMTSAFIALRGTGA